MRADQVPAQGEGTLALEVALFFVAAAAGLGLVRLTTTPMAAHVWLPVLVCLSAGYGAVAVVRRVALAVVALVSGMVATLLFCAWIFAPRSTLAGIPTGKTVHGLAHLIDQAGTVIRGQATPLPATSGVVLCLALGAGLCGVLARLLLGRGRWRGRTALAVCLVPPAGVFAYASLLSSEVDRVQASLAFIAALVLYAWVADRPWVAARLSGNGGTHKTRPSGWGVIFALCSSAAVLLVPLAVSPALAGMHVDAVPFAGGSSAGPPGALGSASRNSISALDLIVDLRAVVVDRADQTLLTVQSPFPTYWQVATLSSFNGSQWRADTATLDAAFGDLSIASDFLPVLPAPAPSSTFDASVQIVALSSSLLAVPPNTSVVPGTESATVVPSVGVVRSPPAPPGFTYNTVSSIGPTRLSVPSSPAGSVPKALLSPYLALPPLSARVSALAHRIVRGLSSQAAEAAALVRFFANGTFHYSLVPPPASSDPLSTFLFDTRTGFCQQFAAAYAVMARAVGLPTRLAVGFTSGEAMKNGGYRLTGADAHVWPQVYLGPNLGWVSFEPTPPSSGAPSHASGIFSGKSTFGLGASGNPAHANAGQSSRPVSSGTAPQGTSQSAGTLQRTGQPRTGARRTATPHHSAGGSFPWGWVVLAVVCVAAAGVVGRNHWRRLLDAVRVRLLPPRAAVVASWERACQDLSRRRLSRRSAETVSEHARRVATRVSAAGATYAELAGLAERAAYSPEPVSHDEARRARQLRARLCREIVPASRSTPAPVWSRS